MNSQLSERIRQHSANFSKGQRIIARYIEEHSEQVAFMTASRLGQTVGVSESTVVRFATEIGYSGYPALQQAMQEMIRSKMTSVQRLERTSTTIPMDRLLDEVRFTVIRGNISEVKTLASGAGTTKGVDADVADRVTEENLDGAVAFAKAFAAKTGAVVAITGAIDIVADGAKAYCIRNGHPMMSAITGTGCQLSALTAAFITANPSQPLEAAAAAVCAMGLAGEIAHARLTPLDGNATYRNYIIDAIYNMTPAQLEEGAKYEVR